MAVCLGNICRSPMAEAVLQTKANAAGLAAVVDSSGTARWHAGGPADPRARRVLAEHGYELEHSARNFDVRWFDERDLIVAMDLDNLADLEQLARTPEHRAKLALLRSYDPALAHRRPPDDALAVPDPYLGTLADFENVLSMIERAADGLVTELLASRR